MHVMDMIAAVSRTIKKHGLYLQHALNIEKKLGGCISVSGIPAFIAYARYKVFPPQIVIQTYVDVFVSGMILICSAGEMEHTRVFPALTY